MDINKKIEEVLAPRKNFNPLKTLIGLMEIKEELEKEKEEGNMKSFKVRLRVSSITIENPKTEELIRIVGNGIAQLANSKTKNLLKLSKSHKTAAEQLTIDGIPELGTKEINFELSKEEIEECFLYSFENSIKQKRPKGKTKGRNMKMKIETNFECIYIEENGRRFAFPIVNADWGAHESTGARTIFHKELKIWWPESNSIKNIQNAIRLVADVFHAELVAKN